MTPNNPEPVSQSENSAGTPPRLAALKPQPEAPGVRSSSTAGIERGQNSGPQRRPSPVRHIVSRRPIDVDVRTVASPAVEGRVVRRLDRDHAPEYQPIVPPSVANVHPDKRRDPAVGSDGQRSVTPTVGEAHEAGVVAASPISHVGGQH